MLLTVQVIVKTEKKEFIRFLADMQELVEITS